MLPQPPDNGRPLLVPGQMKVHHAYHPSPMKDATILRIDQEGTITFNTFGGRTNLEDAALQMAVAVAAADVDRRLTHTDIAKESVALAKAVMDEARRCDPLIPDSPAAQAVEELEAQAQEIARKALVENAQRTGNAITPTVVDSPIASDDRL